jgi:TonB family protein
MILSSIVLLPVLAIGQASASAESKPSTSSAVLQAELTQPIGLAEVVKAAVAADAAASTASMNTVGRSAVREFVQTRVTEDFTHSALRQAGTLEYGFNGSEPTEESAPKLTRKVELQLTQKELAAQPALTLVAVSGTVDEFGVLRNPTVTQSAGSTIDKKALEAISECRFQPATVDNRAVDAAVTIAIKIQKK